MSDPIPKPPENPAPRVQVAVERPAHVKVLTAEVLTKSLTAVATNAWKMRGRVIDAQTKEPKTEINKDDVKKLIRNVESVFEALSALGIEVRDRTGEAYDYGLPDKIVSSSPQAGLSKELIVETIRPTIFWENQLAQIGEVVIATPLETKKESNE